MASEISEEDAKHLMIYNAVAPELYYLPKIHKQGLPLRPIVSLISGVTYKLSKFLSSVLTDSFAKRTNYNILDSFKFVNDIDGILLPHNYVLISFDVISLFTNVPMNLLNESLSANWHLIEPHNDLTKKAF